MAVKTDTELIAEAGVIRDETEAGANTRGRIADILENIVDSKLTLKTWTFADNGDQFPVADAPTLYIVLDEHGSFGVSGHVPIHSWMIALNAGASEFADFIIKP